MLKQYPKASLRDVAISRRYLCDIALGNYFGQDPVVEPNLIKCMINSPNTNKSVVPPFQIQARIKKTCGAQLIQNHPRRHILQTFRGHLLFSSSTIWEDHGFLALPLPVA